VTPNQAAKILHVSLSTLKKFIYSGKIRTVKTPGGHHRIRKRDLFSIAELPASEDQPGELTGKMLYELTRSFMDIFGRRCLRCSRHADSVSRISVDIARRLNFSERQVELVRLAALLHDIGMLGISEQVLNKKTPLSYDESQLIKTHPLLGEEFVKPVRQFAGCGRIIRQHHERYDGKGYPDGLSKDQICPEAKVISLAEAFDAMTSTDSYREPMSEKTARDEIVKNAGEQFDPYVTDAFVKS